MSNRVPNQDKLIQSVLSYEQRQSQKTAKKDSERERLLQRYNKKVTVSTTGSEDLNDTGAWENAQKLLLEELAREERQKAKRSEKNKKRKHKKDQKPSESNDEISSNVGTLSEAEPHHQEIITPTSPISPQKEIVAEISLADALEKAEIELVIQQDSVAALNMEISQILADLAAARKEQEDLVVKNRQLAATLADKKKERDIIHGQKKLVKGDDAAKRVEELRRDLNDVDHKRMRARQEWEKSLSQSLSGIQSEIEIVQLKIQKMQAEKKKSPENSEEGKLARAASESLEKEREKLFGVCRMIGVPESAIETSKKSLVFVCPFISVADAKRIVTERQNKSDAEIEVIKSAHKESADRFDHKISIIQNDVPRLLMLGGESKGFSSEVVEMAKEILEKAIRK